MAQIITPFGLIPFGTRVGLGSINAAAQTYRVPGPEYKAAVSRVDQRIARVTIAASGILMALPRGDRHSLRVRNVGNVDLRIGHTRAEATGASNYLELNVGEEKTFEIHYSGDQVVSETDSRKIFHCEWQDELWLNNPSAVSEGIIEIFEVL